VRRARQRLWFVAALAGGIACADTKSTPTRSVPVGPTPDSFRVAFETTRGTFVVEAHRAWSPKGVDRLHELVSAGLLDDNAFYRVVPKFIIQFGALADPKVNARWDSLRIADDPRVEQNRRGTMAFAQEGPGSRTHQLFINLSDNPHLDRAGFVPIGRVVDGMQVVDSVYTGYREKPEYHLIATLGNAYLRRMFPRLDYIVTARLSTSAGLASVGQTGIFFR
jgi:peptidyl-prolyl cis-trans isomerase A (cyclophilin A)